MGRTMYLLGIFLSLGILIGIKRNSSLNKPDVFLFTEIADDVFPRHRFMSAYEQRIEPPDRKWQYLLFAAEPYETIAFKVSDRTGLYERITSGLVLVDHVKLTCQNQIRLLNIQQWLGRKKSSHK
jgi:Splicing factor 3a, subunit 2